ncbi:hypothetical protein Mp_2g22470 [Marchantia polymorpha subsp. ruderalis]|uniref:Uncharacterized protein n=1 Tax=Marchantia polymorpha TaxID=3197 RepID=A0A2R6WNB0_MARPO|nr:hypothetical protein MARPO_0072s0084 [Marchantia polymorpha]BBN03306.1 hypothetical protein Mp_2g22470 [Marchantia polymorpha subsp. ruderalis]|eukprot:PTQ35345.1 hypothetical protein MARPO_0072s0084 [Marchantia polymorpha]
MVSFPVKGERARERKHARPRVGPGEARAFVAALLIEFHKWRCLRSRRGEARRGQEKRRAVQRRGRRGEERRAGQGSGALVRSRILVLTPEGARSRSSSSSSRRAEEEQRRERGGNESRGEGGTAWKRKGPQRRGEEREREGKGRKGKAEGERNGGEGRRGEGRGGEERPGGERREVRGGDETRGEGRGREGRGGEGKGKRRKRRSGRVLCCSLSLPLFWLAGWLAGWLGLSGLGLAWACNFSSASSPLLVLLLLILFSFELFLGFLACHLSIHLLPVHFLVRLVRRPVWLVFSLLLSHSVCLPLVVLEITGPWDCSPVWLLTCAVGSIAARIHYKLHAKNLSRPLVAVRGTVL